MAPPPMAPPPMAPPPIIPTPPGSRVPSRRPRPRSYLLDAVQRSSPRALRRGACPRCRARGVGLSLTFPCKRTLTLGCCIIQSRRHNVVVLVYRVPHLGNPKCKEQKRWAGRVRLRATAVFTWSAARVGAPDSTIPARKTSTRVIQVVQLFIVKNIACGLSRALVPVQLRMVPVQLP